MKKKINKSKIIFREILKGKTLSRTLQNIAFSQIQLSGKGIDLGSKTNNSSYYKFLIIEDKTEIIFTDLYPKTKDILKLNLEKTFPIADNSQDFLLLTNVLEHLYDYETCLSESYRILKKSGRLIGTSPFLHKIHCDPDDFFRYSQSSLKRMFKAAGFKDITIKPLGFGPFSVASTFTARFLKFKFLIYITHIIAIGLDKLAHKFFKNKEVAKYENYPLSYFFICKK